MNKEDILLLVDYFSDKDVMSIQDMDKLVKKLELIKKQIEAQDIIEEVRKELAELDKIKD